MNNEMQYSPDGHIGVGVNEKPTNANAMHVRASVSGFSLSAQSWPAGDGAD
jgi:hypothetical protein